MNYRIIGCDFRTASVEIRERLAFDERAASDAVLTLAQKTEGEAILLATCNRVELHVARPVGKAPFDRQEGAAFLASTRGVSVEAIRPALYVHEDSGAVRHLFRVAGGLDSLVLGEGQISGQVKQSYQQAQQLGTAGPYLNALFQRALHVAGLVRSETGIDRGHVSISSVAVDYVRQVFDSFADKTILVIGVGKMGRLTLKHLKELQPGRIVIVNRTLDKAKAAAAECGGKAIPWESLDDALTEADIVLSTTGAAEPIMPAARYFSRVAPRRPGRQVILDIAVPRDFESAIHDGDRVCVFNMDDLQRVCDLNLAERRKKTGGAEVLVESETRKFVDDWSRRRSGPIIGALVAEADRLREEIVTPLLARLDGKLTAEEQKHLEGAFRLFQNRLLHAPKAALEEAGRDGSAVTLRESLKRLFRL